VRTVFWIGGRVLTAVLTMIGVSILIFAAARLLPGSYADLVLGPLGSPEAKQAVTESLGLDQNIVTQYLLWFSAAVRGEFGTSFVTGLPVADEIALRLPVTVGITIITLVVTVLVGIPLGFLTARRTTGVFAPVGRVVGALGISAPEFVVASAVVFLVSRSAIGIAIGGYVPLTENPWVSVSSLLLPALVLSVFCITATARATRDAVLAVGVEPHISAAVGRGESPWFIVRHHMLRNISIPVLTIATTIMASLLGGTVIVENIFNVPGVGSYLVAALDRRDYLVIQAGVLLAAAVFIVTSLLVDLVSGYLDPRLRARLQGATA
jgi:peptide/nickel transport system permease protein